MSGGPDGTLDGPGLSRKTIVNHLNLTHGVFAFAVRHGWFLTKLACTE